MSKGFFSLMRLASCYCVLTFISTPLHASVSSSGNMVGVVLASEGKQGLPLATVQIEGSSIGTSTNARGEFQLQSIPEGKYTLIVRLLGYQETRLENVAVTAGKTTRLNIWLEETPIALDEVRVTGERKKGLDDVSISALTVEPYRAKTLPGVGEDVFRTLQTLPGVLAPNDFTSQLVIRGSGPDQNLIVMDGIEVFNPYRLYGIISMFNPETASDINLITGGFPAKYGDRLSAVLDVTTREGDKTTRLGGSLNASITNANLVLNGRSPFGLEGSYVFSARRTYYDLILGPIAKNNGLVSGDVAFPNFTDFQMKGVLEPGKGHKIVGSGLFSKDAVNIISGPERKGPDSINIADDTRNDVLGLTWHYLPSKDYYSKFGISWYRNAGTTEFGGDFIDPSLNRELFQNGDTTGIRFFNAEFDSRYVFRKVSIKEEMSWSSRKHVIDLGAGIDMLKTSILWHFRPDSTFRALLQARGVALVDNIVQTKEYERLNLYLQDRIQLSGRLSMQPGLRLDYYGILGKAYLHPRFNASFDVDPLTTIRGAWGIFFQSPGYEKLLDRDNFIDLTNAGIGWLKAEQATHYVLGIDRWLDSDWQMRVETYYKKFSDVIVQQYLLGTLYDTSPVSGGNPRDTTGWTRPFAVQGDSLTANPINGARGSAYGFEVLLQRKNVSEESDLSGWVSYAFAKADRIRDGITTPFKFDQRHTVNVVLDYRLNSWLDLGIRWRYGSNFPFTEPVGIKPRIVTVKRRDGQIEPVIQTDASGNVIFNIDRGGESNKNSGQLPPYHRLDMRLTAKADYWGLNWNFYLDVINVYNRENVLAYRFYITDDLKIGRSIVAMLPILPTLGFSVRF
jgi:outer membrane cobalamin receptor